MAEVSSPRFRPYPYLVALGLVALTAAYGWSKYSSLPDPFPTHSGFDGTPDEWGAKNVWNVFGPLMIAAAVACGLAMIGKLTTRSLRQPGWGSTASDERSRMGVAMSVRLLEIVTVWMTAMICALTLLTWNDVRGWLSATVALSFMVLVFLAVGMTLYRMIKRDPGPHHSGDPSSPRALDDDPTKWRWGIIYNNPDDPRTVVPKRFGVGSTINMATPAGKAFTWGILLLVPVGIIIPMLVK